MTSPPPASAPVLGGTSRPWAAPAAPWPRSPAVRSEPRGARSGRDRQRQDGPLPQQAQREQDSVGPEGGAGEHGRSPFPVGRGSGGRYRTKSVAWKFTSESISIRISAPAVASVRLTSTTVSP